MEHRLVLFDSLGFFLVFGDGFLVGFVSGFFWGGGALFCGGLLGVFFVTEDYFASVENVGPELEEIKEIVAKPTPVRGSLPSC